MKERHFVILQGPPGTGKSRGANEVLRKHFKGRGTTIQFHPAVTYEDLMVGLAPDPHAKELRFNIRYGWLVEAALATKDQDYLLVIDEINRADLGKVLGEAIYLFEPREIGEREITLAHPVEGAKTFRLPPNLHVLGTMNTSDRSIATMDLAIRRRFAFMTMFPDRQAVVTGSVSKAIPVFDKIVSVFAEHADDEALHLLPGQSYFLAKTDGELKNRFLYDLLPLLDEYLRAGLVGPFAVELQAVRDAIEDWCHHGYWNG